MPSSKKAKELNEPDPSEIAFFEEEMLKPYYKADYLDHFKFDQEKLDVSMIIPTFNRCPYKPDTLKEAHNPLYWSIMSSFLQKPKIKEMIIVDDASTDHTFEFVKKMQKIGKEKFDIPVKYIKNETKVGPGMARNIGARNSNAKYLFFIDDDSFITPYMVFGGVFTFEKMSEKGIKVGIINLPHYQRATHPSKVLPKKEIGYLNFLTAEFKSNKDAFPEEYLYCDSQEKFLDSEFHILNPFPILNLNTVLLCSRACFEEVEGFREHYINRGEDREFGCRVIENGYTIYFQPDLKFHCVHGSYGLHNKNGFKGDDWFKQMDKSISIKKAMELCDQPKENSGTRINPTEYLYQTMLANFFLTFMRNKKGAVNWTKKRYKEFVVEAKENFLGGKMQLPGEKERRDIWFSVIKDGLALIKKEEKINFKKIVSAVKELKENKKIKGSVVDL